jgi:hypothetical protein
MLWRLSVTLVALVLLLFAWHDAFWIPLNQSMHVQPWSTAVYTWHHQVQALVRIAMLVFALLTAWRTRCDFNARLLTEALIGGSADIYWQWWGYQDSQFWVLFPMMLKYFGTSFGLMRFIQFAAKFGTGDYKGIRDALYRYAPWVLLVGVFGVAGPLLKLPAAVNPLHNWDNTWAGPKDIDHIHSLYLLGDALAKLAMIAAAYIGWRTSAPEKRQRMQLVLISFVSYGLGTAIHFLGGIFLGDLAILNWIDAILTLVLPIGLVTALFQKHLFDVQLFLDRAVGGAAVATILLVLARQMDSNTHNFADNLGRWAEVPFAKSSLPPHVIEIIVGVGIGLFFFAYIHKTHALLEKSVRRAIFPGREGRMRKLHQFRAELITINDPALLRRRLVEVLRDFAKAEFSNAFVKEGDRYIPAFWSEKERPADVAAERPEIAMLRRQPWVQLDDRPSPVAGVLAFPMIIAGRLYGFLAVGQSRVQARYDLDEIHELSAIARETGVILFAVRSHGE